MMRKAKIIEESETKSDIVSVGTKVKVKDMASGNEMDFIIVGSTEADPFEGKISNESLVGAALLNKRIEEVAEIAVPDGIVNYKIVSIG